MRDSCVALDGACGRARRAAIALLSVFVNDRHWRSHPLRSIATQHHRPYRLRAML